MIDENKKDLYLKLLYFTSLAGASILFGFSYSLGRSRKSRNDIADAKIHGQAVDLAKKALMKATLYSVGSMSVIAITTYYLFIKSTIDGKKHDKKVV